MKSITSNILTIVMFIIFTANLTSCMTNTNNSNPTPDRTSEFVGTWKNQNGIIFKLTSDGLGVVTAPTQVNEIKWHTDMNFAASGVTTGVCRLIYERKMSNGSYGNREAYVVTSLTANEIKLGKSHVWIRQ